MISTPLSYNHHGTPLCPACASPMEHILTLNLWAHRWAVIDCYKPACLLFSRFKPISFQCVGETLDHGAQICGLAFHAAAFPHIPVKLISTKLCVIFWWSSASLMLPVNPLLILGQKLSLKTIFPRPRLKNLPSNLLPAELPPSPLTPILYSLHNACTNPHLLSFN